MANLEQKLATDWVFSPRIGRLLARLFAASGIALCLTAPQFAEAGSHLPDAALKVGTVFIENDAQFTTNVQVLLKLAAAAPASVTGMQFSNDGREWSAPESYKSTKQWQLGEATFPPRMDTVLVTVYARFRLTGGAWSKAVSDSILLARSADAIPRINEVWIDQSRPSDYSSAQPLGSRRNPFIVPQTNNQVAFDSLMHSLMTNHAGYYPTGWGTNAPRAATNDTTLTLHIGRGVYETHGDETGYGANLAWSPRHGWRILGAGKHLTTLKAVHYKPGQMRSVIGLFSITARGIGMYDNFEIADLTVDANTHEGGSNYLYRASTCLNFYGNNAQIRRVKTKNAATTIDGWETMHIHMHNFGAPADGTHNVLIEDCTVIQPQVGNLYPSGLLSVAGQYGPSGAMHYFHNVVVRNCDLNGAAFEGDIPVNRAQHSVWDRGRFGIGIGGARNVVLEDNHVQEVTFGYYIDSVRLHDITITHNHFRNVCFGFSMDLVNANGHMNVLEDTGLFENNLVELDPRHFPIRDTWGTLGGRFGFRTIGELRGPDLFTFEKLIVRSNIFQFTDKAKPEPNVSAVSCQIQGVRSALIQSNTFIGDFPALRWDLQDACLLRQPDILSDASPVPFFGSANRVNSLALEEYPVVLDKSLSRPTALAGQATEFIVPEIDGVRASVALGFPEAVTPPGSGGLVYRTKPGDAGSYVVSFYASTNRSQNPRRTLLTILPPYPPEDSRALVAGLAGYWRLSETLGDTLADSSGNGAHVNISWALGTGRLTLGKPGLTSGSVALGATATTNSGIAFSVANSAPEILRGLPSAYHPLFNTNVTLFHPFAISLWIKPGTQTVPEAVLATIPSAFYLNLRPGPSSASVFGVAFLSLNGDIAVQTPTNLTSGVWHHVAAVYDGVSAQLYVDGLKAGEDNFGQIAGWAPDRWVYIGGGGSGWGAYNGDIDEVAIWNRALGPEEVSFLYARQLAGMEISVAPLPPSFVMVSASYEGWIDLSWQDDSSNESGYLVERSSDGVSFLQVASLGRDSAGTADKPAEAGTYIYRVRATNTFGLSAPALAQASVLFVPVTNRLTLVTNGVGLIEPLNFSTNRLDVGGLYAVRAVPGEGFAFVSWTDGTGIVRTNQPILSFVMEPNLVLAANFADVRTPQVSILTPESNKRFTNAAVSVVGTAADNHKVSRVMVSVNTTYFTQAQTTNNWATWTLPNQRLGAGTNIIRAYTIDATGLLSSTATNKPYLVSMSQLTLVTNGSGVIKRSFTGTTLEVGKAYQLLASPLSGYVFSNWTGGVTSESSKLTFLMQSNLVLRANFIPNPFKHAKGTYYGLFTQSPRAQFQSGSFALALTETGSYSASIRIGPTKYGITGKLDVRGRSVVNMARPGTNDLVANFVVNLSNPGRLTGTIGDGKWSAILEANRAAKVSDPIAQYAGRYTLVVPGSSDLNKPQGNGFSTITVAKGKVVCSGWMADGAPFSHSTYLASDGVWPMYIPLYAGYGSALSWMRFATNLPPSDVSGSLNWNRPPQAGSSLYPNGFTNIVLAEGTRYTPPLNTSSRALEVTNVLLTAEGGNILSPVRHVLTLAMPGNRFVSTNSSIRMSLNSTNGVLTGSILLPGSATQTLMRGAVLQKLNTGYGFLIGTNRSSEVFFEKH